MSRRLAHTNGTPHRIAVTYLENDKDEILVQVRMSGRLDHSSAGHVDPGESYLETAKRELKEELGIEGENLISIGKGRSEEKSPISEHNPEPIHLVHVFEVFACKSEPKDLAKDEVKKVYWARPGNIIKEMKESPEKFTGGFMESIKVYLNWKGK